MGPTFYINNFQTPTVFLHLQICEATKQNVLEVMHIKVLVFYVVALGFLMANLAGNPIEINVD